MNEAPALGSAGASARPLMNTTRKGRAPAGAQQGKPRP